MAIERVAIVGTASTWKDTPWDDPGLHVVSLNDAYSLGVPRADAWFDLHPIDKMWFRPKGKTTFREGEIPEGAYVRPEGHLEWLKDKAKTIPVWLRDDPPADWPVNAKRFPIEDIKQFLKARPDQEAFIASSPAMILAHYVLQGVKEVHIYGIHLATQGEYVKQLPNFLWLLGKVEAMGIEIVLPPECPLLKHTHVYGYEPEPQRPDAEAIKRQKQIQGQMNKVYTTLVQWPRWKSKDQPLAELTRLKAALRDAQLQARHAVVTAGVGA